MCLNNLFLFMNTIFIKTFLTNLILGLHFENLRNFLILINFLFLTLIHSILQYFLLMFTINITNYLFAESEIAGHIIFLLFLRIYKFLFNQLLKYFSSNKHK